MQILNQIKDFKLKVSKQHLISKDQSINNLCQSYTLIQTSLLESFLLIA